MDLVPHAIEHRRPPGNRLAAPIGTPVRRPPLALAPGGLEAGREAVEIDDDRLLARRLGPPLVDPLAQLRLRRPDLRQQQYGIGVAGQPAQPRPAVLTHPRLPEDPGQ